MSGINCGEIFYLATIEQIGIVSSILTARAFSWIEWKSVRMFAAAWIGFTDRTSKHDWFFICTYTLNGNMLQFLVRCLESGIMKIFFWNFTSKLSCVRENFILYKSALTLWTTFVTYSKSHSQDDRLQSDSLLLGCMHVSFGTLLNKILNHFL